MGGEVDCISLFRFKTFFPLVDLLRRIFVIFFFIRKSKSGGK